MKDKSGAVLLNRSIPRRYHVLFWVGYFVFNVVRWGSYFNDYWYSLKSNLVEFPLHIVLVYLNIYYLVPKFILKRHYRNYVLWLMASLFGIYVLRTGFNYILVTENIWPEAYGEQTAYTFNHIIAVVVGELYVVALCTAIKLTVDWIYERQKAEKLRKVQLRTELNFLKSQIQPHFFFNTLNNLYALTLEKSDVAPSVVLKLSDIMQYVLYDVREPKIRLYKEISYIQNYIDLERMRYEDRVQSTTDIAGNIDDVMVPPLLFLPFIENCFKHGTRDKSNIHVAISFKVDKNKMLTFRVENSISDMSDKIERQGIGIQNVRRRLELLFKKRFELKTSMSEDKYSVFLKIPFE